MSSEAANGLKWLLSELTDNIIEHSETDFGWLSYQLYPQLKILDLCICDTGIGLYNSYKNPKDGSDYSYIMDHADAIEAVLSGDSTKDNKERGFGVRTSIKAIKEGFKGQIVLGSGCAITDGTDVFHLKAFTIQSPGNISCHKTLPK